MQVFRPRTLDEALETRAEHPEAVPVAGATDVWVDVSAGRLRPAALLDLSRVDELREWRRDDGRVFVGAGTTFTRVACELREFRALAESARAVASPQIRNRATIGGNVATASPAGDALPVLLAYRAEVLLASACATRRVALEAFLRGPKRTGLRPDELIVGVEWRPAPGPGSFAKVGVRNAMVIAVASACVQLDERAHGVRLALGSVGPTVLRAARAEAFASALPWGEPAQDALVEFGRLAAADARPIDDPRATAAYRRHAVRVLAQRMLAWALDDRREGPC